MKKKNIIPKNERFAAAKYFAISNAAMLDMTFSKNINTKYIEADRILCSEIGTGLDEEFDMWLKDIEAGDEYCAEQWNKVKHEYTF